MNGTEQVSQGGAHVITSGFWCAPRQLVPPTDATEDSVETMIGLLMHAKQGEQVSVAWLRLELFQLFGHAMHKTNMTGMQILGTLCACQRLLAT